MLYILKPQNLPPTSMHNQIPSIHFSAAPQYNTKMIPFRITAKYQQMGKKGMWPG